MSNFYKDTMNIPIAGAEYGFNGVIDPEYARGHRAALIAASKIALDADVLVNSLETELAAANAELTRLRKGGCARDQHTTQYCAEGAKWCDSAARYAEHIARMDIRLEEAKELLLQAHEPDQGQLRTQWDKDVDEWIKKAAQAEIARLREGRKIHNCEAAEAQISALEKDAAMLDWLADHEAVKNINRVNLSIYETAMCIAYERDVDAEPTVEDYRLALRLMIRTAINAEAAEAARGNDD